MGDLVFNGFAEWLMGLVLRMCQQALEQLTSVLESSSTVSFDSGWWVQPTSQALLRSVSLLAAAMMVGFLLLAVLQGLVTGETTGSLRALLVEVPISVLGMAAVAGVAGVLLKLTDAASAALIGDGGGAAGQLLITLANPLNHNGPLAGLLMGLMALATLLVWVELVVRASLIYLLVAFSPLLLAARVWPAARPVWRKGLETGLALIFSKLAIALALALGAAALKGAPPGEVDLSGLLAGATTMGTAAFTPFALLRLVPAVEAALAGQGISRAPARGLMSALQAGYYARALGALGGRSASGGPQQSTPPPGGSDLPGSGVGGGGESPASPPGQGPAPGEASGVRSRPPAPRGAGSAAVAVPEPASAPRPAAALRTMAPLSAPPREPVASSAGPQDAPAVLSDVPAEARDGEGEPRQPVIVGLPAGVEQHMPVTAHRAPPSATSEPALPTAARRQVRPLGVPARPTPSRRFQPTHPGPAGPAPSRPGDTPRPAPRRHVPPPVPAAQGEHQP